MLLFFQRIHRKFGFIPVGFLGLDSTLSLFECLTSNVVKVADYFLAAGVLWGWLSAITGLFSLYAIRGKKRAFYYATAHGYINGMALLVLTILWANETTSHKAGPAVKTAVVALKFGMLAVLFYGISFSIKRVRKEN